VDKTVGCVTTEFQL